MLDFGTAVVGQYFNNKRFGLDWVDLPLQATTATTIESIAFHGPGKYSLGF